jgi:polyhydroxyalkanoate synthesis repressor PhaR
MAKPEEPTVIKKYANRRLYNTGTSTYVTLEDLAAMVKKGEDFVVYDAKTSEDITRSVLTQIIFEQENKAGQNLLPAPFLRQLIRFYGDSMQMLVPRYLEVSIESLTREQEKFRQQMSQAFGAGPFAPLEEQVRRNMEMFERAFTMFVPFARRETQGTDRSADRAAESPAATEPHQATDSQKPAAESADEIDDLKRQLEEVQKRLNRLSETKG